MKKMLKTRSLGSLIQLVVSIIIIIAVATISISSIVSFNNMLNEKSRAEAETALRVVDETFATKKDTLYVYAHTLAAKDDLKKALAATDHDSALSLMTEQVKLMGITYISATNADGIMVVRTNDPDNYGDDVSGLGPVALALQGTANIDAAVGSTAYNLVSCVPVYGDNGEIVGEVNACVTLNGNQELVQLLSDTSGTQCALYMNDKCTASTIDSLNDTVLPEDIAETVINQGETHITNAVIDGTSYLVGYSPIKTSAGAVSGVIMAAVDMTDINQKTQSLTILIIVFSIGIILIGNVVFVLLMRKRVKMPLNKIVTAAKTIETGSVDEEVKRLLGTVRVNDEIGSLARSIEGAVASIEQVANDTKLLKEASDRHDLTVSVDTGRHSGIYKTIIDTVTTLFDAIRQVIVQIRQTAEDIDKNSELVASVSQSLAQVTTEQAGSIEELAATITEISEQIKSNAKSTADASVISNENMDEVRKGSRSMEDLTSAIEDINNTSVKISNIIKAIEDIAFQTNILALNASVEAARAGAAGKGFAVVAEEVKNLATKSAAEASNTTELINASLASVNKGMRIAKETAGNLTAVVDKTVQVDKIIVSISEATQSEADAVSQVDVSISQISDVIQSNSATAEETSAASEELSQQAAKLREMVVKYKV